MDTPNLAHRRSRQHARRILADIRIRSRDLTRSIFTTVIDLPDGQPPLRVFRHSSGYQRNGR
jgi:hypothetical protein